MEKRAYGRGKDVRVAFRITPELKRQLDEFARQNNKTLTEVMEDALRYYINYWDQ